MAPQVERIRPMDERVRVLLSNLLRRDYLTTDQARLVITDACTTAGHPAKIAKPFELKQEHERGCVCGRQPYA